MGVFLLIAYREITVYKILFTQNYCLLHSMFSQD